MKIVFLEMQVGVYDEVIEVGAIKVVDGVPTEKYYSFARPKEKIPVGLEVTFGVTNEHLIGAPPAIQVVKEVLEFINGCLVVTYTMDPPYLANEILDRAKECGISDFSVKTLELFPIVEMKYPASKGYPSFFNVAEYFGVYDPRGDSLSRSIILMKLYHNLYLPI